MCAHFREAMDDHYTNCSCVKHFYRNQICNSECFNSPEVIRTSTILMMKETNFVESP